MGLKAPASGVAPPMFIQASRGLWEEACRGVSSDRDSIIAYAWWARGHTAHRTGGEWLWPLCSPFPGLSLPCSWAQRPTGGGGSEGAGQDTRAEEEDGRGRREAEGSAGRLCRGELGRMARAGAPQASLGCSPLQSPPTPTFLCLVTRKQYGQACALGGPWERLVATAKTLSPSHSLLGGRLHRPLW